MFNKFDCWINYGVVDGLNEEYLYIDGERDDVVENGRVVNVREDIYIGDVLRIDFRKYLYEDKCVEYEII